MLQPYWLLDPLVEIVVEFVSGRMDRGAVPEVCVCVSSRRVLERNYTVG